MKFKNKVVVITGGGTGLGKATALKFAREGAHVAILGRREEELNIVVNEIEKNGSEALAIQADVSIESDVEKSIQQVVDKWGRLDVAFNNAGMLGEMKPITELESSDFDKTMAVNTKGVWLCIRAELQAMLKTKTSGVIVNTSSFVARAPNAGGSVYAASKAALDAMIQAVALEVGGSNIRVNNIAPGVIKTPMSSDLPQEFQTALANHSALKRLGEPEDIADAVLWLCSDDARFITGQSILVDGGIAIPGFR
ncbi:SDR family NAD(P)-dependent oxidoreductase [Vibrio rhizosphaerae]|uniref:3-oxoacyl-ACP reductase family protein n=1 Tax=Vibrio rhizosphaerae TaxID=398736 RepID=A0ABU4ISU5_9VIBR|nr:3-oxoacyl-ACP reductase family protein [Vibrio rhizosphaerae]MDW6092482.1 3-oxoacyl-ACP reductase family protein [Vibrio rhizosphaerae]